jgi:diguanylate cyclase (GGDEF)-like protein
VRLCAPRLGTCVIEIQPLVAILAAAGVILAVTAALLAFALWGRGPLAGSLLDPAGRERRAEAEGRGGGSYSSTRPVKEAVARHRLSGPEPRPTGERRSSADELEDVLRGSFAAETYNRAVRVMAWAFILAVLLVVSLWGQWPAAQPQILVTLALAGGFVLVAHELLPPGRVGLARLILDGSVVLVFLTVLVLLTGFTASPFFFLYAILVGGAALIADPVVALALAVETAFAYAVTALAGPLDPGSVQTAALQVAINLTVLGLLSYAGIVIARTQRRTRDAAIRLSTVDSLTDLYNRAFMFNAVEREIERARRYRRGFCLLMMDLDGLKAINDHFGHYQGDVVLRGVAQSIRSSLRTIDVAARYGGDEFVALLPETDPTGAYVVAEKIRQVVSGLSYEDARRQITTSLSIGVVSFPEDGETADELMIAADEAMYLSKRLGKNRVVGYTEPAPDDSGQAGSPRPDRPDEPGFAVFRPRSREGSNRQRD